MDDRTPIQAVMPIATGVLEMLRPLVSRMELAGSIRRLERTVKDIEVVATPRMIGDGFLGDECLNVQEIQAKSSTLGKVVKCGTRYIQVLDVLGSGITLDLFLVHPPAEWGPIFAIRTGPADYSQMLVTRIKGRLWRCENGWVRDQHGERVPCPTEDDFFQAALLPWCPPEEREGLPGWNVPQCEERR